MKKDSYSILNALFLIIAHIRSNPHKYVYFHVLQTLLADFEYAA